MKIVKVTYTAKLEYVEQNQNNIKKVMADLRELNNPNINYTACLCPDGKTFIHTAFYNSDEDQNILTGLSSFQSFQTELKAHGLEVPPKQELLTLVGSSKDLFNS
jgi:hypothetical protein